MSKVKNEELLKNAQVQEEISRHRWIESEKAGTDIGFDKAAADWLNSYSDGWLAHNKPAAVKEVKAAKAAPKRDAKKVAKK
jgi:hypothetical protein